MASYTAGHFPVGRSLPDQAFESALHVHDQESVLRIGDGLPKMRDVPTEMGGTGETLGE